MPYQYSSLHWSLHGRNRKHSNSFPWLRPSNNSCVNFHQQQQLTHQCQNKPLSIVRKSSQLWGSSQSSTAPQGWMPWHTSCTRAFPELFPCKRPTGFHHRPAILLLLLPLFPNCCTVQIPPPPEATQLPAHPAQSLLFEQGMLLPPSLLQEPLLECPLPQPLSTYIDCNKNMVY